MRDRGVRIDEGGLWIVALLLLAIAGCSFISPLLAVTNAPPPPTQPAGGESRIEN